MKKVLLGTAVALALLTGCTEEKKETPVQKTEVAPVSKVVEEVKKEAEATTQAVEEVKKEVEATEEKKEETK
ncbi:MAG: hypothetical protein PHD79_10515 [Aliarcobacter sp.]|nr:hypothetical protein [Aliarcobacter sp.]